MAPKTKVASRKGKKSKDDEKEERRRREERERKAAEEEREGERAFHQFDARVSCITLPCSLRFSYVSLTS